LVNEYILYYEAEHVVTAMLTGDYKTDRELIFGKGGFIKDKPLIKALMMITGYLKSKYYVTPDEQFEDEIVSIYDGKISRYWFIELASALMARVTNYFQALQGVRDEDKESIKTDIENIISEFLAHRNPAYTVNFIITFDDTKPSYTVTLEVYRE